MLPPASESGRPPLWHSFLYRIHDLLTRNDPVTSADLIFVPAGRMERKRYGLALYQAGFAPRLLLSVGRFEVSKMSAIGFAGAAQLVAERDRTPPRQRHFFCEISAAGLRHEKPALPRWNTYGELVGLRDYLQDRLPRQILFVSTGVHLRRISLTFARTFRGLPVEAQIGRAHV